MDDIQAGNSRATRSSLLILRNLSALPTQRLRSLMDGPHALPYPCYCYLFYPSPVIESIRASDDDKARVIETGQTMPQGFYDIYGLTT